MTANASGAVGSDDVTRDVGGTGPARAPSRLPTALVIRARRRKPLQRAAAPYLFLAPFAVLFLAVLVGPFAFAVWLSLHEWNGFGPFEARGLANYRELFANQEFHTAIWNTAIYAVAILGSLIPSSLLLAVALNARRLRARSLLRSLFLAPTAASTVVIAVAFVLVFDPKYGLINAALERTLGGNGVDWLGAPWPARFSVIIVVFWRSLGLTVLFFLAGLQNISTDQIDAARVDGAKGHQVFRHIVLPGLRPITMFLLVIGVISMLQLFEEPFILTGGGPNHATETLVQLSYRAAFVEGRFGYASAIGVVLVAAILIGAAVLSSSRRLASLVDSHQARARSGNSANTHTVVDVRR